METETRKEVLHAGVNTFLIVHYCPLFLLFLMAASPAGCSLELHLSLLGVHCPGSKGADYKCSTAATGHLFSFSRPAASSVSWPEAWNSLKPQLERVKEWIIHPLTPSNV